MLLRSHRPDTQRIPPAIHQVQHLLAARNIHNSFKGFNIAKVSPAFHGWRASNELEIVT
jgi:hypothetical protein